MSGCQWRDTGTSSVVSEFSLEGEIAEADVGRKEWPSRQQEPCVPRHGAVRNHRVCEELPVIGSFLFSPCAVFPLWHTGSSLWQVCGLL